MKSNGLRTRAHERDDRRRQEDPCFDKRECISLRVAAKIAGKSESTTRIWCDEYGLGRRIGGGTWAVSKVAQAMFLDGDTGPCRLITPATGTGTWWLRIFDGPGSELQLDRPLNDRNGPHVALRGKCEAHWNGQHEDCFNQIEVEDLWEFWQWQRKS
jgi:hypothetical protein